MNFESDLWAALILATLAGASIPLGGVLAWFDRSPPGRTDSGVRHFVTAFGAGALISAIALVLVPEGISQVSHFWALTLFGLGGIIFMLVDRLLAQSGGHAAQFLAMMLDYLPEAMALGALLADEPQVAMLMAFLIAMQNLPEGFNAYREMREGGMRAGRVLILFLLMVPVGPMAAAVGLLVLEGMPGVLGGIMMFSSGGILYLLIQDIAPQVPMKHSWMPPMGAVAGFMLGLAGHMMTLG